jgi:hypothetical protein
MALQMLQTCKSGVTVPANMNCCIIMCTLDLLRLLMGVQSHFEQLWRILLLSREWSPLRKESGSITAPRPSA